MSPGDGIVRRVARGWKGLEGIRRKQGRRVFLVDIRFPASGFVSAAALRIAEGGSVLCWSCSTIFVAKSR